MPVIEVVFKEDVLDRLQRLCHGKKVEFASWVELKQLIGLTSTAHRLCDAVIQLKQEGSLAYFSPTERQRADRTIETHLINASLSDDQATVIEVLQSRDGRFTVIANGLSHEELALEFGVADAEEILDAFVANGTVLLEETIDRKITRVYRLVV